MLTDLYLFDTCAPFFMLSSQHLLTPKLKWCEAAFVSLINLQDTESLPAQIRTLDPELQERVKEFRAHPNAKPYLDDPKYNDFFLARCVCNDPVSPVKILESA